MTQQNTGLLSRDEKAGGQQQMVLQIDTAISRLRHHVDGPDGIMASIDHANAQVTL